MSDTLTAIGAVIGIVVGAGSLVAAAIHLLRRAIAVEHAARRVKALEARLRHLDRLDGQVDAIFRFLMDRAEVEAVQRGLANSPPED